MSALSNDKHGSSTLEGNYSYTNTLKGVYYGAGSLATALPKLRAKIGGTKALVVTGKSLYTKVSPHIVELLRRRNGHGRRLEGSQCRELLDIRAGLCL